MLGCRVSLDGEGRLVGALGRRVEVAADAYGHLGDALGIVIASGGRRWGGVVESDAMARGLVRLGVPERVITRERCSLSTRDNARFVAEDLARRGIARATVVTCEWHLPRAVALFERQGLDVEGLASRTGRTPWSRKVWRWGREHVLGWAQATRS